MSKKDTKTKKPKKETKKTATKKKPIKKDTAKKAAAKKKTAPAPNKKSAPEKQPAQQVQNGQQQSNAQGIQSQGMPYTIHAQYVRDASFENPNAIDAMRPNLPVPEMDINIGMDARRIDGTNMENFYEVALNIRAEAKRGETTVFIAELQYGTAVSIEDGVPQDSHHPLLLIEVPRMIFPYARRIVSDLTVEGGYPPLLINPVDFQALYLQRFGQKA